MKPIVVALLLLVVTLPGLTSAALAQTEPLLLETDADFTFGEEVRFTMYAQNAAELETLTLAIRPEMSTNSYQIAVPFQPGEVVSVTQRISVDQLELHPFSEVSYSWRAETADGEWTTPAQRLSYEDDQLRWQSMVRDAATVHWTGGEPIFGQTILDITDRAQERLLAQLPLANIASYDLYVYPSSAELRAAAGTGEGEARQDLLRQSVLLVTAVNEQTAVTDLEQSVPYELAHLFLYRAAGDQYGALPWWLREGIAQGARQSVNQRHSDLLAAAIQSGQTIAVWRLCDDPQETGDRADLAAAQSGSLLRHIAGNGPADTTARLVAAFVAGDNCEEGVQRVLDQSLDELESEWLDAMSGSPGSGRPGSGSAMWLLLLLAGSFLALILYLVTRKENQST